MIKNIFYIAFLFLCFNIKAFSQEISISISPQNLNFGELLHISIISKNEKIKTYGNFPEINGFKKAGLSSSSSTNFINGKVSSSQEITQNYIALKEGEIIIMPFKIKVNGNEVRSIKKTILVNKKKLQQQKQPFNNFFDPFEDNFFNRNQDEFIDVEADAFLSLNTSKKIIYVGEGFNTTLSFFVSEDNVADRDFLI